MSVRDVVIVVFDGVDVLDVTGPADVFALVGRDSAGQHTYRVTLAAPRAEIVTTSAGIRLVPDVDLAGLVHSGRDTLIVPGAVRVEDGRVRALTDPEVVEWIAHEGTRFRRVASVCVGAHLLAAAGVLDGRRATTHWSTSDQLAAEHPEITVDPDPIFIRDGSVWTAAGITSGIDLALALVADDFGEELALAVARQLVVYVKRSGGQSQFSVPLQAGPVSREVEDLMVYVRENPAADLRVERLAERIRLSPRQLARVFRTELDQTPAAYVESARVEGARRRLESTDDGLSRIAAECGFGSVDTLSRAFHRHLKTTPTAYRQRFRVGTAADY